ncbi:MAG: hypothetical protein ACMXYD_05625 [Candidatus Woesearchaeota archaeon]
MSAPLYVQVKNKQQVLAAIHAVKQELAQTRDVLEDLYNIQTEENKQLHLIQQSVQHIHQRVAFVQEAFEHE